MGVGETALRRWVDQLSAERIGITPKAKALTPDQQQIQALEKRIKRLELEKKILKVWWLLQGILIKKHEKMFTNI